MTTEKIAWISLIICLISLGWLCSRPNEPVTEKISQEVIDSNLFYDEIELMYQSKQLRLYDSIETLNNRLKSTKTIFITKYRQILKDSLITDSNCLVTLYYANETINQQDSIINLQSHGLDACSLQVDNLRKQVQNNQDLKTEYQKLYKETFAENQKLERKAKRNRLFAGIVSAILVSFVIIK